MNENKGSENKTVALAVGLPLLCVKNVSTYWLTEHMVLLHGTNNKLRWHFKKEAKKTLQQQQVMPFNGSTLSLSKIMAFKSTASEKRKRTVLIERIMHTNAHEVKFINEIYDFSRTSDLCLCFLLFLKHEARNNASCWGSNT